MFWAVRRRIPPCLGERSTSQFDIKADTLLRMQTTYELAQARKHEQDIKVQKFARAA